MNILIKDLTKEQSDTILAFSKALKEMSIKDIQIRNPIGIEWEDLLDKKTCYFDLGFSYRIKPQPSYLDLHKKSGLKVGDRVRVICNEIKEENGFRFTRYEQREYRLKSYVGEISWDDDDLGFWVDGEYLFPFYALEKIEEEWAMKYKSRSGNSRWFLSSNVYKSEREAREDITNTDQFDYEFIKIK